MKKSYSIIARFFLVLVSVCFLNISAALAGTATLVYDTSFIEGDSYLLAFDLINGDETVGNTVTISNLNLNAGVLSNVIDALTTGGVAGNLATSVVLTDSDFLNSFGQEFVAGSTLSFQIDFTNNLASDDAIPDSFSFSILNDSYGELPTTDWLGTNKLLRFDLNSTTTVDDIQTFEITPVPEPASLLLLGAGLGGLAFTLQRRTKLNDLFTGIAGVLAGSPVSARRGK